MTRRVMEKLLWHGLTPFRRACAAGWCCALVVVLALPPASAQDIRQLSCAVGVPATAPAAPGDSASLEPVHRIATGAGVTVAVIDTGISVHPRLTSVRPGSDHVMPEAPNPLFDCDGHGTVVAGIIAAQPSETDSVVGIAPGAELLSIKQASSRYVVDGNRTAGTLATLAQAIDDAIEAGAQVINASVTSCVATEVASHVTTSGILEALQRAEDAGAVVVAAAGNASSDCEDDALVFPAHGPHVLAVGARNGPYQLAEYSLPVPGGKGLSATGSVPVALAPDGNGLIEALTEQSREGERSSPAPRLLQGTSFAAPVVSGIAALLIERYPTYTPAQVRAHILAASQPPTGAVNTAEVMALSPDHPRVRAMLGSTAPRREPQPPPTTVTTHAPSRAATVAGFLAVLTAATTCGLGFRRGNHRP